MFVHDNLLVFLNSFFILVLILRRLEDPNALIFNVGQNLDSSAIRPMRDDLIRVTHPLLEKHDLFFRQCIRFRDHGDQVDFHM